MVQQARLDVRQVTRRRIGVVLAAGALIAVSCGSGDGEGSPPTTVGGSDGAAPTSTERPGSADETVRPDDPASDDAAEVDDMTVVGDLDGIGAELWIPPGAIAEGTEVEVGPAEPLPLPAGVSLVSDRVVDFAAGTGPQRADLPLHLVLAVPPDVDLDPGALRIGHHDPGADRADPWTWSTPDEVVADQVEATLYHLPTVAIVSFDDDWLLAEFAMRRGLIELVRFGGGRLPGDRADHLDLWLHPETEMLCDSYLHGATGRFGYDVAAQDWDELQLQLGGLAADATRRWGDDGVEFLRGYAELRAREEAMVERSRDLWLELSERMVAAGWLAPDADGSISIAADGGGLGTVLGEFDRLIDRFIADTGRHRLVTDETYEAMRPEYRVDDGVFPISAIAALFETWFASPVEEREGAYGQLIGDLGMSEESETVVDGRGDGQVSTSVPEVEGVARRVQAAGSATLNPDFNRSLEFSFDLIVRPDRTGEGSATFSAELPSSEVSELLLQLDRDTVTFQAGGALWILPLERGSDGEAWVSFYADGFSGVGPAMTLVVTEIDPAD